MVRDELRAHGASELQVGIARVVVYAFGIDTVPVATSTLQARCGRWGIAGRYAPAPSYGAVAGVLDWMQRHGWIAWAKAHVPRWHGVLPPGERPRLYPRYSSKAGAPRLPARRLHAIGRLLALLGGHQRASDRTQYYPAPCRRTEQESSIRGALVASEKREQSTDPGPPVDRSALDALRERLFGRS